RTRGAEREEEARVPGPAGTLRARVGAAELRIHELDVAREVEVEIDGVAARTREFVRYGPAVGREVDQSPAVKHSLIQSFLLDLHILQFRKREMANDRATPLPLPLEGAPGFGWVQAVYDRGVVRGRGAEVVPPRRLAVVDVRAGVE